MKKKLLTILALTLGLGSSFAQDVVVIEDFDSNRHLNAWTADSGSFFISVAEAPGSETDTVGSYFLSTKILDNGANFIGSLVDGIMGATEAWSSYNVDEYPYYSIDAYSDQTFNLALKIEDGCCGDPKPKLAEEFADYENVNEWQTLYFDLTDAVQLGTKNELVFLIDIFNESTEKQLYFDNFTAYRNNPNVGLSDSKKIARNLELSPNPSVGAVKISSELSGELEVSVFNNYGHEVLTTAMTNGEMLNVAGLENGIYTVHVSNSAEVAVNRLIISK